MKILNFVKDMSKVSRWSQAHCHVRESSLEHTAAVSIIALYIATQFPAANLEKILVRAIVHDMEEPITGDITTPTKYHNPNITKEIKLFEDIAAREISKVFDSPSGGNWAYEAWRDAKDDTLEGDIIQIADKAAVVYKIKHEISLGNKEFCQYEENVWNALYVIKCTIKHPKLIPIIHDLMDYLQEK